MLYIIPYLSCTWKVLPFYHLIIIQKYIITDYISTLYIFNPVTHSFFNWNFRNFVFLNMSFLLFFEEFKWQLFNTKTRSSIAIYSLAEKKFKN